MAARSSVFAAFAIEPPQAAPAPAKPEPAEQEPAEQEPAAAPNSRAAPGGRARDAPARGGRRGTAAAAAGYGPAGPSPQRFNPTEKVRADFPVSFPIDI